MPLCEIRIPTYRRPDLLRRALSCVAAQTVDDLRCIVFDDSPDREAEPVVGEFPQLDIDYRPNPKNLGISRNLGQCFRTKAFHIADYAFCLEDDNCIEPTFIAENIAVIRRTGVAIVVRDQLIRQPGGSISTHNTTLKAGFKEVVHNKEAILLTLFFSMGLPNGSLFWSTSAKSELCIGLDCPDPAMQERFRPFAFQERWAFSAQPLFVFNGEISNSFRRRRLRLAEEVARRWRFVGILRVRRHAISRLDESGLWTQVLEALAPHMMEQVERGAAWACRPLSFGRLTHFPLLRRYAGGLAGLAIRGPTLGQSFERLLASSRLEDQSHSIATPNAR